MRENGRTRWLMLLTLLFLSPALESCLIVDGGSYPPGDVPVEPAPCSGDPDACSTYCADQAERYFHDCWMAGGDSSYCQSRAEAIYASCMESCTSGDCAEPTPGEPTPGEPTPGEPTPGPDEPTPNEPTPDEPTPVEPTPYEPPPTPEEPSTSCQENCHDYANEVYETCLDYGGSYQMCEEHFRYILDSCLSTCDWEEDEVPPPAPPCEESCTVNAHEMLEQCLAAGGDPESCQMRFEQALESCLEGCSGEQPPPPAECGESCELQARELYSSCVEHGGDQETCQLKAQEALESCLAGCEGGDQPPPSSECPDRCASFAREVQQECLETGGDPAVCEEKARAHYESCMGECMGDCG